MRYRIVMEIEVSEQKPRKAVNELAHDIATLTVTSWSNPVFLSTELVVERQEVQVLRE